MDIITGTLLAICTLVFSVYIIKKHRENRTLPPGSLGLPLIGQTLQLMKDIYIDVYPEVATRGKKPQGLPILDNDQRESSFRSPDLLLTLAQKYRHENAYKQHLFGFPSIVIMSAKHIEHLLSQEHILANVDVPRSLSLLLGEDALTTNVGDVHRQKRKWIMKVFSKKALDSYLPGLTQIVKETLGRWQSVKQPVVVVDEVQRMISHLATVVIAGVPADDTHTRRELTKLIDDVTSNLFVLPLNIPGFTFYRVLKKRQRILDILKTIYSTRDSGSSGTVMDTLRAQCLSPQLESADQVTGMLIELFIDSNLTLKSALSMIVFFMAKFPNEKEKLREEVSQWQGTEMTSVSILRLQYVNAFMKEVLRIEPPAGNVYRKLKYSYQIDEYVIPAGWNVKLRIRDAHDRATIPNGKDFCPDRWLDGSLKGNRAVEILAFGGGPRRCLGKAYAELIMRIFIIEIAKLNFRRQDNEDTITRFPVPLPKNKLPIYFD